MGAIVTQNTTDQCALPACREAFFRIPSWTTWHEIRMGMFWQVIPTSGSDAAAVAESCVVSTYQDWFTFGVKDTSLIPPGTAGSQFVGAYGTGTLQVIANGGAAQTIGGTKNAASMNGATLLTTDTSFWALPYPIYNASSYCAFAGLRLVVNSDGAAGQTITPSWYSAVGPIATVTMQSLRTYMAQVGTSYVAGTALTWNASGVALPLPYMAYIRFPFLLNRFRISAFDYDKIS